MRSSRLLIAGAIAIAGFLVISLQLLASYRSLSADGHLDLNSIKPYQHVKSNPWSELDDSEVEQLYEFLYQDVPLNLSKGSIRDGGRHLYVVESFWPEKHNVLSYLVTDTLKVERYARVVVVDFTPETIITSDLKVGPLPPSENTVIEPLVSNSGKNSIKTPLFDFYLFLDWTLTIGESIADITLDLLGAKVDRKSTSEPELQFVSRPALIEDGRMVHWLEFFLPGLNSDGWSLLPQGLYLKLDTSSPDPDTWQMLEIYYNGIIYSNISAFRNAWKLPGFVKLNRNADGPWTSIEDFETDVPGRQSQPPLSIQPYGPRYRLNTEHDHVSWMGFSFYFATRQFTGLSLFDIEFRGERIMYEVGLQEALAHYAGSEPMQSGLEWLDAFFGFGATMFSLVPGYDCPSYADYVDMQWYRAGKTQVNKNAICIFEFTDHAPLQRHTGPNAVSVSRNTYLVIRSVSTVGNYDYTIDYILYLDGTIEVKVRASGFIFAAFLAEAKPHDSNHSVTILNSNNDYGHRIHEAVSSSIHDHVLNFKADLDIGGNTLNTFTRTHIRPVSRKYPWDTPEVPASGMRNTMKLVTAPVTHETALDWPRNSRELFLISSNETNAWGEQRSYRITPGTGMGTPAHLTIVNSTALGKSALWSTSDLFILRHHDNETSSAHHLNFLSPLDPLVDFQKMLADNESLCGSYEGESQHAKNTRHEECQGDDLVVYFNLGSHHVPSSSDVPNTLMHTSASSVMFVPHNYFDSDVSRELRQGVRIEKLRAKSKHHEPEQSEGRLASETNRDEVNIRYFGGKYDATEDIVIHGKQLEPDLRDYMKLRGPLGVWAEADNGARLVNSAGTGFGPWHEEEHAEGSSKGYIGQREGEIRH